MDERRAWLAAAAVLAAALLGFAAPGRAAADEGRLLGLVIGASDYAPGGLPLGPLDGPRNDALLIAELLVERGAAPGDVVVLTGADAPGGYQPSRAVAVAGQPTAGAILAAFAHLTSRVRPGDEVVILLAGHGWRQREGVPGSEPDGLDEVFLPIDYGPLPQGFDRDRHDPAPGALRDDEIGAFIDALRARGADVFLIADFCHAGDSTRGVLDPARPGPREPRLDPVADPGRDGPGRGGYVAFFAAPAGGRAMQGLAPIWAEPDARRPHGLLTAYTAAALRDPAVTTYAEAAARVQASLLEHDVRDASVRLEGPAVFEGDLERPLPGGAGGAGPVWTARKPAVDAVDGRVSLSRLELDAGALHGLDEGAVVAVAEVRGGRERLLLYGRAVEVGVTGSVLVPATYGDLDAAAWADVRAADGRPYTDRRLWLARPVTRGEGAALRVARPEGLAGLLDGLESEAPLRWAAPGAEADLHLHPTAGGIVLSGDADPANAAAALGRVEPAALRTAVARAARSHRLRRVLAGVARDRPGAPGLETAFHLWRPPEGAEGGACPPFDPRHAALVDRPPADAVAFAELGVSPGDPVTLRPCDVIFVRAANAGAALLDVAVVALAPDGAVWPLPWTGDRGAVRFEPGRARLTAYQLDPRGSGDLWEELVLVAAPADGGGGAPLSLSGLRQPGVAAPAIPGGDELRSDGGGDPVAELLRRGGTRGGAEAASGAPVSVRRLMIRVAD